MSIYHKQILAGALKVASCEDDPQLSSILFEPSGEIVAINKWALFIASPAPATILKSLPISDMRLSAPVAVTAEQCEIIVKAIPADKMFKAKLEHFSILNNTGNLLSISFNNGRGNQNISVRSSAIHPALGSWRKRFRELGTRAGTLAEYTFIRSRLSAVTDAINTACKYSGEFDYVYQRVFSNGYIWRATNGLTGQTVLIAWTLPSGAVEQSHWENSLLRQGALTRPK